MSQLERAVFNLAGSQKQPDVDLFKASNQYTMEEFLKILSSDDGMVRLSLYFDCSQSSCDISLRTLLDRFPSQHGALFKCVMSNHGFFKRLVMAEEGGARPVKTLIEWIALDKALTLPKEVRLRRVVRIMHQVFMNEPFTDELLKNVGRYFFDEMHTILRSLSFEDDNSVNALFDLTENPLFTSSEAIKNKLCHYRKECVRVYRAELRRRLQRQWCRVIASADQASEVPLVKFFSINVGLKKLIGGLMVLYATSERAPSESFPAAAFVT